MYHRFQFFFGEIPRAYAAALPRPYFEARIALTFVFLAAFAANGPLARRGVRLEAARKVGRERVVSAVQSFATLVKTRTGENDQLITHPLS